MKGRKAKVFAEWSSDGERWHWVYECRYNGMLYLSGCRCTWVECMAMVEYWFSYSIPIYGWSDSRLDARG